ncbi:MAG: phospholipase D-like domain-containing protein, partial [Pirellulales bacterium]|nr:phospholipase D-like domain-containing protein [Pirellulales bacterium]
MFVQNQPSGTQSHKSVIEELIRSSEEVRFMVAFVKEGGIDLLSDALKGKQAKLLCTFDLGITDLSAMKKLLDLGEGVEIREHRGGAGTFHPKVWMFRTGTTWRVVVGSANLTKAALTRNVEASVVLEDENTVKSALDLFDRLWKHKNSEEISLRNIASLKQVETRRVTRNRNILKVQPAGDEDAEAKVAALLEFVTSWMTIDVSEKLPGTDQRLWRGWYIIPDHGYVDDEKISRLKGYLRFVGDSGLALDKGNPVYNELISKFLDVEGLIGRPLSTS